MTGVQGGIRILEDQLQVAAQRADLAVGQTRKVDAVVAQPSYFWNSGSAAYFARIASMLAHVVHLGTRRIGELFLDASAMFSAQLVPCPCSRHGILAFSLAFRDCRRPRRHRSSCTVGAASHRLVQVHGAAVFLQEDASDRAEVLRGDKAANDVRHVQIAHRSRLLAAVQLVVLVHFASARPAAS